MQRPGYQSAIWNANAMRRHGDGERFLDSVVPPVSCPHCSGLPVPAPQDLTRPWLLHAPGAAYPGLFAWLGRQNDIPTTSVVHTQLQAGAFNHPNVLAGASPCGHLIFCAPSTSVDILAKHGHKNPDVLFKYLDVSHSSSASQFTLNGLDWLETFGETSKPSRLSLTGGYWIELEYLQAFSTATTGGCALQPHSLDLLQWMLAAALLHRHESGGDWFDQQDVRWKALTASTRRKPSLATGGALDPSACCFVPS